MMKCIFNRQDETPVSHRLDSSVALIYSYNIRSNNTIRFNEGIIR